MKRKIFVTIVVVFCFAFFAEAYWSSTHIEVTGYEIANEKIPKEFDGFKIVQLTDFHDKKFCDNAISFTNIIKAQEPDIIVMTGDMVTDVDKDFSPFFNLCWQLKGICPIYFVEGNHEKCLWYYGVTVFLPKVEEYGVKILRNETIPIIRNGSQINLVGYDLDVKHYHGDGNPAKDIEKGEMNQLLGTADKSKFNIMLAHSPSFFDDYVEWGADLILTGHFHGGLIRLPGLGGLLSPDRAFLPKYDGGAFYQGKSEMIVGRGIGNSNKIPRMFNNPEIVAITLKSA